MRITMNELTKQMETQLDNRYTDLANVENNFQPANASSGCRTIP